MTPQDFEFKISRQFKAPLERVWRAWTEPDQLEKWLGPKGSIGLFSHMDFREGGSHHYGMQSEDGSKMYGKWRILQIKPLEKIVFLQCFTDEAGDQPLRHPMAPTWPLYMHSTYLFSSKGEETEVTVLWRAHDATDAEKQVFFDAAAGMNMGWSGSFDRFDALLAEG